MPSKKDVFVSQTQINDFRTCEQRFYYRHVQGLKPQQAESPLELGSLLHTYLELYYNALSDGRKAVKAHALAFDGTFDEWDPKINQIVEGAIASGAPEDVISTFEHMGDQAQLLIDRYFEIRGRQDAKDHDIILVEKSLAVKLGAGLSSTGVIDLVTRRRADGKTMLWEHKSTVSIPSTAYRMQDLQTLLYAAKLRDVLSLNIEGVVWNYIKTVPPKVPETLKKGGLSRRKDIDSTWFVYQEAVKAAGFDPVDYDDMRIILQGREEETYYPRYEHLLVAREDVILRDYIQTAKDIKRLRAAWEKGKQSPVRTTSRNCDWCPFRHLCQAEILGGNEDAVVDLRYSRWEDRHPEAVVA